MLEFFTHDQIKRIANILDGLIQVVVGSLLINGIIFFKTVDVAIINGGIIFVVVMVWMSLHLERISQKG